MQLAKAKAEAKALKLESELGCGCLSIKMSSHFAAGYVAVVKRFLPLVAGSLLNK